MGNPESYSSHEEYLEWYRDYRKKNREKLLAYHRKYRLSYRKANYKIVTEKDNARQKVRNAIKKGIILRQPCMKCGNPKTQGHHTDYSKPLDVIWLCQKHHKELHRA